jgi:hypothetical protein
MSKKPHTQPRYKCGTVTKDGCTYGRYPDGTLYRIYPTANRPFVTVVDVGGDTYLRIRQATEAGYTDCPCPGVADLSYRYERLGYEGKAFDYRCCTLLKRL